MEFFFKYLKKEMIFRKSKMKKKIRQIDLRVILWEFS